MDLKKSMEKQNDVVVRLAKHVIATVAAGYNLVFSPTPVNVLLSIIAAGSSSVSKEQILSFLNSPSTDHLNGILSEIVSVALADGGETSALRLSAANGVWIDKSISLKPSFKVILENSYKATCSEVDFASKPAEVIDEVNTWAGIHTNGLIEQILSHGPLHDQYLMEYDDFQVLRLPYVEDQRQFSMYFYLPYDKDGLPALVERIGSEPGFLDKHIPNHQTGVCGLTEMVDSPTIGENLYVSSVLHKAFIEVDEEGTESAAVSVAATRYLCSSDDPFIADHPFLFTVREDRVE
ncbi:hypothetical protein Bca4012_088956 [Brassica carinata]